MSEERIRQAKGNGLVRVLVWVSEPIVTPVEYRSASKQTPDPAIASIGSAPGRRNGGGGFGEGFGYGGGIGGKGLNRGGRNNGCV